MTSILEKISTSVDTNNGTWIKSINKLNKKTQAFENALWWCCLFSSHPGTYCVEVDYFVLRPIFFIAYLLNKILHRISPEDFISQPAFETCASCIERVIRAYKLFWRHRFGSNRTRDFPLAHSAPDSATFFELSTPLTRMTIKLILIYLVSWWGFSVVSSEMTSKFEDTSIFWDT